MNQIQTPDTSHVDYERVYEPAEDSFLLLDCIEKDLELLRQRGPVLCVEVGSGSGVISSGLAAALKTHVFVFASDINPDACTATKATIETNRVAGNTDVIQSDLLSGLVNRLTGQVDILLCNPPYVGTDCSEVGHADISSSWAGGAKGRNVTDRLIKMLPFLLAPKGLAYLVLEQCNEPKSVLALATSLCLKAEIALSRRAGIEMLYVARIERK